MFQAIDLATGYPSAPLSYTEEHGCLSIHAETTKNNVSRATVSALTTTTQRRTRTRRPQASKALTKSGATVAPPVRKKRMVLSSAHVATTSPPSAPAKHAELTRASCLHSPTASEVAALYTTTVLPTSTR